LTTTLITPLIVAREALISLENNMVMGNLVHRGYEKEFKNVGATVITRKPTVFTATAFTSTVGYSTITESSVTVILNQHWDVSFEVTSQELSLDVVDFNEQFLEPAGRGIAQAVDSTIFSLASTAVAAHYPVSSTPAVADVAGLGAVMDVMKVPMSQRRLVFHPTTEAAYISLDAFLNADKRGDGARALREAELGRVMGFDTYMDQNVKRITTAIDNTSTAVLQGTLTAAGTAAGTQLRADLGGTSEVLAIGDIFKVTGYDEWHVITTATTLSSGTCLLSFSPALISAYASGSTVTFQGDHKANLGFHKNAFALVSAPLVPPIGGAKAAVVSHNGLACRVVYGYDQQYKKNQISVDFLCGFKVLDKDLAARLCDAR
jgi:hypothetical protein